MPKKIVEEVIEPLIEQHQETELEHLHALYAELKSLAVNSIGDLENLIARLQK